MTTILTEFNTNGGKHSASFLSYRRYGCCLCTKSGLKDLFDFDTSILHDIRESASYSHFSFPQQRHNYQSLQLERSEHCSLASSQEEQETFLYKLTISGGIIWFIQYCIYSILLSIYPLQYIDQHTTNIYYVAVIIILIPLSSILFVPICHKYSLVYKLRASRCIVVGLLLEGILCIVFQFTPNILPDRDSTYDSPITKDAVFCLLNAVIRIFSSMLSVLIELSFIAIVVQVTPPEILITQQYMPLFCMVGLMSGPFMSGYLYYIQYEIPYAIIGIMIIISTFIVYRYINIPQPMRNDNIVSHTSCTSYLSAFRNMNVVYSSTIAIYSLICISYLMFNLSLYLHTIDWHYFNTETHSGVVYIATYYFILGITYIIVSFLAAAITYSNCGSLRTMLCGLFGIAIGLLLVSTIDVVFPPYLQNRLEVIVIGLIITGASAAFSITPYVLYIRNAIFRKYKKETTEASFNIYRLILCLAISIGPSIACLTYDDAYSIELTLFVLSMIACLISIVGFILFKCLRWKIQQKDTDKQKQDVIEYEIKYIPILQDDKACCFCQQMMCFFSFGAWIDPQYELYNKLKNEHKRRKKKKRIKRGRMRSRKSFDETLVETGNDGVVKVRKKASLIFDRISFDGSTVDSEYTGMYGNDGKTVTKDNYILAQSWNTILNRTNQVLHIAPLNLDRSTSGSASLTREKSRILTADDIHTPRGDTAKAISHSQKRNANVEPAKVVMNSNDIELKLDQYEDIKSASDDHKRSDGIRARHMLHCAPDMEQIQNVGLRRHEAISRRSFSGSGTPLDPTTPHPTYTRTVSLGSSALSSTEPPSQTFLLLSDEDFMSRFSSDVHNTVSNEKTEEESNT